MRSVAGFLLNSPSLPHTESGEHAGRGQRSLRRLGPRLRRTTAGSENQGRAGPGRRSQWRPLLRYSRRHKRSTLECRWMKRLKFPQRSNKSRKLEFMKPQAFLYLGF